MNGSNKRMNRREWMTHKQNSIRLLRQCTQAQLRELQERITDNSEKQNETK